MADLPACFQIKIIFAILRRLQTYLLIFLVENTVVVLEKV